MRKPCVFLLGSIREFGSLDRLIDRHINFTHRRSSDYEKIIAAAADFTSGRVWPVNFASETGPKFIWEKVYYFIYS